MRILIMSFFSKENAGEMPQPVSIHQKSDVPDEKKMSSADHSSADKIAEPQSISTTHHNKKPPLWLLVMIIGLPLLSETVYTPSLINVAHALNTNHTWVEYTLSIYLAAFAIGTLLWGCISDRYGRKKPLVLGLVMYAVGSMLCALSTSIEMLLLSRFIQAFGGSTGSILGQVICRDVFQGKDRGVVFSSLGAILSVAPAIGPVCGGLLAEYLSWRGTFMMLFCLGMITSIASFVFLKETHPNLSLQHKHSLRSLLQVAQTMLSDPKVLIFGALIGGMNGVMFSYYGEGAFYLMEQLGLRPFYYGLTFILLSSASIGGSLVSKFLLKRGLSYTSIVRLGLLSTVIAMAVFVGSVSFSWIHPSSPILGLVLTLLCMSMLYFGMDTAKPSLLSHALDKYQHVSGTASSLFGGYYYTVIALITVGMAYGRADDMLRMPLYFLSIVVFMMGLFFWFQKKSAVDAS